MRRSILRSSTAALALTMAVPAAAQEDLEAACDIPTLSAGNPEAALLERCRDAGLLTAGDVELLQAQDLPDEAEPDGAADQGGAAVDDPVETDVQGAEAGEQDAEADAQGAEADVQDAQAGGPDAGAEGEIVVDQAPEASVEEGAAVQDTAEAEPSPTDGEGDATLEVEEDGAEGLRGAEGTLDVDPAEGDPEDDAAIVVDQAPEAEVPEGAATAEPDPAAPAGEATEDAAQDDADAADGSGDAEATDEPAEGEAPLDEVGREAQDGAEEAETPADDGAEAPTDAGDDTAQPAAEGERPAEPTAVEDGEGEAQDGTGEVETPADAPVDDGADAPVDEADREARDGTEEAGTPADAPADGGADALVDEAGREAQDGTEEVVTPADDAAEAPAEDRGAEAGVEPSEITTDSLGRALEEAADQDLQEGAVEGAPQTEDVGLGEQTEAATPEERAGGDDALEDALAEAEAAVGGSMEAAQEDSEESTARANEAPAAAAAASEDAALPEEEAVTLTEEATRSADEEFAVEEDEEGLSSFERALLVGLGAVTVGSLLNDGGQVVENTGDRVVVERDGRLEVLKDDDELLRRPGSQVSQRRYDDGSTLTVVEREDGTRITTVRAPDGQVLRRSRTLPDGAEVVLFDDTRAVEPVDVSRIEELRGRSARDREVTDLAAALGGGAAPELDRAYSLQQIRQIRAVRELMPQIDVQAIEFDTGSAVIRPTEAEALRDVGVAMADAIEANPDEVFLVEGHTDAVGSAASNLALSDRRAESVALALTEYFGVPPESMVAQGYGESNLRVRTEEAERANRRASVRRITPLLRGASLQ